jgi:hypothetical protein
VKVEHAVATLVALMPEIAIVALAKRLDEAKRDRAYGSVTVELHLSRGDVRTSFVSCRHTWQTEPRGGEVPKP